MDLRKINAESQNLSSNPFAQFFNKDQADAGAKPAKESRPEARPPGKVSGEAPGEE